MTNRTLSSIACSSLFCFMLVTACTDRAEQHNRLSDQEQAEGWTLLFDGKSLAGWHLYNKGNTPSAWSPDSGALVCNPRAKNIKHGDLVTDKVYENYDLRFEWKISKGGNSGLFINVQERPELTNTFASGPEYQLLDDKNKDAEYLQNQTHKAGAIFGVIPNKNPAGPTPGQWNQSRILQQNGKVSFWLNNELTLETDLNSDAWKKLVADSPMINYPEFGKATKGNIALQDWTNGVQFRDIKIKELK